MIELSHLIAVLIEPSSVQAQIIQQSLSEFGIDRVDHFQSAAEALEQLKIQQPDVVISALYLPDMTGTDLVYKMREEDALKDLPFILISSETRPSYLDPIRQAGAMAILPKPFDQKQLQHALNNTLSFINAEAVEFSHADIAELTVLLVDDSKTARHHIRSVLAKIGFEKIFEAADGRDALPLLETTLFDLVVTDYNMPDMDGKELVEHIRTRSIQSSVPILMVSSERDEGRLAGVEQAGVSAICDKPFDTDTVRQLVFGFMADRSAES